MCKLLVKFLNLIFWHIVGASEKPLKKKRKIFVPAVIKNVAKKKKVWLPFLRFFFNKKNNYFNEETFSAMDSGRPARSECLLYIAHNNIVSTILSKKKLFSKKQILGDEKTKTGEPKREASL